MKNVPSLRFTGFNEDWKQVTIGQVSKIYGRIGFRGYTTADIVEKEYGALSLSPSNIVNSKLFLDKENTYISIQKYEESPEIMVFNNDIIFVKTGSTFGKVALVENLNEKATLNPQLVVLKDIQIPSKLLSIIMASSKIQKQVQGAKGGGVVPTLTQKELSGYRFNIPYSTIEQEKIASFFSLIDKKIELQTEKIEELKKYKKGMMQKIFSGELKFKDDNGNEYPEWQEKKLFEYTEKITTKNKDFTITNVISNSAKNGLISQRDFFDKDIANKNNIDGYYVIESGDLVYNPRKSIESPYGPINRYELQDTGVVSPLYLCFRIKSELINGKFLAYYFKSSVWHKFIYQNSDQGIRHDRVSIKDAEFFNMNIGIPLIEEQSKVVKFLDCIEYKLKQEQTKLDYLIEYKKGLLQQMFI